MRLLVSKKELSLIGPERIRELIAELKPDMEARFLRAIEQLKTDTPLPEIERLLVQGRANDALTLVEGAANFFAAGVDEVFIVAGQRSAKWLSSSLEITAHFDVLNPQAIEAMQRNSLSLVREFVADARAATQTALEDGVRRGLNPREQARAFRDAIGLTEKQQRAVQNYRSLLEGGVSRRPYADALGRELRDRRFDRTIERALRGEETLSKEQIDRMVGRYRERYLKYRSETIARTEGLRVVHQGSDETVRQAIANGTLEQGAVIGRWSHSHKQGGRDFHVSMHGQEQPYGTPFVSGLGNMLRYPGDPDAPGEETIACGCAVATLLKS